MSSITGGGDFRIGRDTDGVLKFQFKYNGIWTSIMKSVGANAATTGDSDDLYLTWDAYNGPAQTSSVIYAPEAPYAVTAAPAQTGNYANTHYIDHDGTNDYVDFSTANTDDFMDWEAPSDWSIGFTWDGRKTSQAQTGQYMTIFSNGDCALNFRLSPSNWGIYASGKNPANAFYASGINTWYEPSLGDKYLIQFNQVAKTITVYKNGTLAGTINAVHLVNTYHNANGEFTIGKGTTYGGYFDGGLRNVMLRSGTHLGSAQRDEYFLNEDITGTSFYADTETIDFLRVGEETYPAVNGLKGAVLGTFNNGTAADYVEK